MSFFFPQTLVFNFHLSNYKFCGIFNIFFINISLVPRATKFYFFIVYISKFCFLIQKFSPFGFICDLKHLLSRHAGHQFRRALSMWQLLLPAIKRDKFAYRYTKDTHTMAQIIWSASRLVKVLLDIQ